MVSFHAIHVRDYHKQRRTTVSNGTALFSVASIPQVTPSGEIDFVALAAATPEVAALGRLRSDDDRYAYHHPCDACYERIKANQGVIEAFHYQRNSVLYTQRTFFCDRHRQAS